VPEIVGEIDTFDVIAQGNKLAQLKNLLSLRKERAKSDRGFGKN